jgi:hypothetical protein
MKYVLAIVTLAAFTGMSFAQTQAPAAPAAPAKMEKPAAKHEMKKADVTTGEIASIDTVKNEIVVKDAKGEMKTFAVEAAKIGTLTQGEKVKVMVKDGKVNVKAIKEHMGKHEGKKAEHKKPEAAKAPEAPKAN